jgi:hypothetical protein
MKQWFLKFFDEAKGKLTTYLAIFIAGLSELLEGWDTVQSILPAWVIQQRKHLVAISALFVIYTRVRRKLKDVAAVS